MPQMPMFSPVDFNLHVPTGIKNRYQIMQEMARLENARTAGQVVDLHKSYGQPALQYLIKKDALERFNGR